MSFNTERFNTNLIRVFDLVSSRFDEVVITGSSAIVFFILHHPSFSADANEILEYLGYDAYNGPNDIDLISISNTDIHISKIGEFVSEQSICGSKTFVSSVYENRRFDIIKMPKCKYIELNGINIIHPSALIAHYRNNYRDIDERKLAFLIENEHIFDEIDYEIFDVKHKQRRTPIDVEDNDVEDNDLIANMADTSTNVCRKLF